MKKRFVFGLILCVWLVPVAVLGQTIPARVTVSNGSLTSGSVIDAEVVVDMSGSTAKLGAYSVKLTYDANVLELIETLDGSTLAFAGAQTRQGSGELTFSQFNTQGAGGVVSLLRVRFRVKGVAGASSSLSLSFTTLDAAGTFANLLPQVRVQNATITVGSGQAGSIVGKLNLSTDAPASGDALTVEVVVDLSKVSDKLGAYTAKLTYDAKVLTLLSVGDGTTSAFAHPQTKESTGEVVFSQFSTQGTGGVVNLLKVQFNVIGQAGAKTSLGLSFSTLDAASTFANLLPQIQVSGASITVAETLGGLPQGTSGPIALDLDLAAGDQNKRQTSVNPRSGDLVKIDIAAVSGAFNAIGFHVELRYDTKQLEWNGFQVKDIFATGIALTSINNDTVTVSVAILGGRASKDTGSLGEATFKVLPGFTGETRVRLVVASYDTPVSIGSGGAFVVIGGGSSTPTPDFNGNGTVDFADFLIFASGFGKRSGDASFNSALDLDQSGDVGFGDFLIFAQNFGKTVSSNTGSSTGSGSLGNTQPGSELTATLPNGAQMTFVYIPKGTFTMGSPDNEARSVREVPQHEVTISKGYYLGKYEVTQGQWQGVMGTTPWIGQDNMQANGDNPAVYVNWNDVQAFVHKLNVAAGDSLYQLPSEAEWEYACRAGSTTQWSFGDDESKLKDYAWYDANAWNVGEGYAHQVGTKLANPWGLYDMYGNVWEWCGDWYGSYNSNAQTDPQGPSTGSVRVIRGGAFTYNTGAVRSAYRHFFSPSDRYFYVGFRLLRRAN